MLNVSVQICESDFKSANTVCALQRFTAKFELKSKLMNPANKKVLQMWSK